MSVRHERCYLLAVIEMQPAPHKINFFGNLAPPLISLHQFFNILIKKGRGIRPDEALATLTASLL